MKQVVGGIFEYDYVCTCNGGVGQWIYPNGDPSPEQVQQDIAAFCASNSADCGHYPHA